MSDIEYNNVCHVMPKRARNAWDIGSLVAITYLWYISTASWAPNMAVVISILWWMEAAVQVYAHRRSGCMSYLNKYGGHRQSYYWNVAAVLLLPPLIGWDLYSRGLPDTTETAVDVDPLTL